MTLNLNPGLRDTTVSTSTLRRINPELPQPHSVSNW